MNNIHKTALALRGMGFAVHWLVPREKRPVESGWRTGAMVERYAHLAPDQLGVAAGRLDSLLVGYDLATLHQKRKRLPSLEAA